MDPHVWLLTFSAPYSPAIVRFTPILGSTALTSEVVYLPNIGGVTGAWMTLVCLLPSPLLLFTATVEQRAERTA